MRIRAINMRPGDILVRPDGDRVEVLEVDEVDAFERSAIIQDKDDKLWRLPAIPERWVEVDRGSWVI